MVPKLFIYDEYEPGIVERLLKRQRMMIDRVKENPSVDPRAFLVFDDCLYDNSWTKDKNVRSLFMNGRHFKILFMITMQYALGIPPNLRTNIDYVFILREPYIANRKRIWENYAGMFPTFESFCQVMDQCTENFECLVINNNAKSNKLQDQDINGSKRILLDYSDAVCSWWGDHLSQLGNFGQIPIDRSWQRHGDFGLHFRDN